LSDKIFSRKCFKEKYREVKKIDQKSFWKKKFEETNFKKIDEKTFKFKIKKLR